MPEEAPLGESFLSADEEIPSTSADETGAASLAGEPSGEFHLELEPEEAFAELEPEEAFAELEPEEAFRNNFV